MVAKAEKSKSEPLSDDPIKSILIEESKGDGQSAFRQSRQSKGTPWSVCWQHRCRAGLRDLCPVSVRATLLVVPQNELAWPTTRAHDSAAHALNRRNASLVRPPVCLHGSADRTCTQIWSYFSAGSGSSFFALYVLRRLTRRDCAAAQADPGNGKHETQPT